MQVMDSTVCKLQTVETVAGKPSVRILSWNVNGLRAVCRKHPSASLKGLVGDLNAEIICFQETKLTRQELNEDIAFIPGYDSFFNFANPDKGVSGAYSGVATFCRQGCGVTPLDAMCGVCPLPSLNMNSLPSKINAGIQPHPSSAWLCYLYSLN